MNLLAIAARVAATTAKWVQPKGSWSAFHITKEDRGRSFTFAPKVPFWTNYTDAEDFTTPRVCMAAALDDALTGLFGHMDNAFNADKEVFVYATKSGPKVYVPNSDGTPEDTPDNPYNNDWSWAKYAEEKGLDPKRRSEDHAAAVKGCAPDALRTKEIWSLEPVMMTRIGRMWTDGGGIKTKWSLKETTDAEDED